MQPAAESGGGGAQTPPTAAVATRTAGPHSTSLTSFFPFSSSVDDAPAGGRAGRMCRPQRIRPSSCCVEFVHSHHHRHRHNQRRQQQQRFCDCTSTHYCNCGIRCHRRQNRSTIIRTDTPTMTTTNDRGAPLPAPLLVDADEQKPRRRTLWQALRKNCHWKCFVLTLMIDGCLSIIFWCQWTQRSYLGASTLGTTYDSRKSACEQGYNFIPVAFAVMLYVVYVMECWHCRTRLDLLCRTDIQSVYNYMAQLRDALPVVWWRAVCYHYVRRTRQVTRCGKKEQRRVLCLGFMIVLLKLILPPFHFISICLSMLCCNCFQCPLSMLLHARDFMYSRCVLALCSRRYRNGDAVTSTQVYYERINSHTAGSAFVYQDCGLKDISKKLVDLNRFPVIRLRFRKGFVFANLQAANEFEEQRARFFQENEQRDDYMEVREGLDLVNVSFKENMVAFADPNHRPWFIAQPTFWLCSLLMLSWPLRVLIEYRTAYVNYQATKLFGTNYLSPSSQNYTGPLTRVSTMDSGELEAVLRSNYVIVPSYSEALLMDPVQSRTAVSTGNGSIHIQTRPTAVPSPLDSTHNQFALPSPRRLGGNGPREAILNNERVILNYGALLNEARHASRQSAMDSATGHRPVISRVRSVHPNAAAVSAGGVRTDVSPLQQFIASAQQRSRSLSFLLFRTRSSSDAAHRNSNATGTPHSISFGSLAALARANIWKPYRTLPTTPDLETASDAITGIMHLLDNREADMEAHEEPPPSYDLALKLCQPVATYGGVPTVACGSGAGSSSGRYKWFSSFGSGTSSAVSPSPTVGHTGVDATDKKEQRRLARGNGDDTPL